MLSKNKKAFTLLEILISIIVTTIIGLILLTVEIENKYLSEVDELDGTLKVIIQNGAYGKYALNLYGDENCSSANDYRDISALRIKMCGKLDNNIFFDLGSIIDENPFDDSLVEQKNGKNYFFKLLKKYTKNGGKFYLDENSLNREQLYLFFDFSNLFPAETDEEYVKKEKRVLEKKLKKFIGNSVTYIISYPNATSLELADENSGNNSDGMIKFLVAY